MNITKCLDLVHDTLGLVEPVPSRQSLDGHGSHNKLPINPGLVEATGILKDTLVSWALMVSEEQPRKIDCEDNSLSIAGWLWRSADFLEAHPAREDFITEIRDACNAIRRFVDIADDRVFLGVHAGQEVYVRQGQETVVLPDGRVERVETIRNHMKRQVLDVQGTAKEVSIILRTIFNLHVSPKAITSMWREDVKARERGDLGRLEGLDACAMDGSRPVFVVDEVLLRLKHAKVKVA